MSLPSRVSAALQHAGQAVHSARRELASAAAEQSRKISKALQSGPATKDLDAHFQALRTSVTLAEELTCIHERLAAALAAANGTAAPQMQVAEPPAAKHAQGGPSYSPHPAPMPPSRNPGLQKLRGNNARVWQLLQEHLDGKEFRSVTQARIANGAQIPLGSVAYSISRLVSLALIEEGSVRGSFRLR